MRPRKILQLLPAQRVAAVFRTKEDKYISTPVLVWALTKDIDDDVPQTRIVGMIMRNGNPYLCAADEGDDFVAYEDMDAPPLPIGFTDITNSRDPRHQAAVEQLLSSLYPGRESSET